MGVLRTQRARMEREGEWWGAMGVDVEHLWPKTY